MVAVALVAVGCSSSSSDQDADVDAAEPTETSNVDGITSEGVPVEGGKITVAVGSETDGWNPATNVWAHEGQVVGSSFMEPLMVFNGDGEVVPWLAESVTPNEDASLWTITLREGITFHDGTEMKADDVVESLKFQGTPGALASVVSGPLIGEPVVTGEYSLEIPLNIRWGAFSTTLAANYGYVMAPSMLAQPDNGSTAPVGTGAFRFEKAEKDRYVRVVRFDDYWGGPCAVAEPSADVVEMCEDVGVPLGQRNGPFLDSMEFRPITDSLQRMQALQAGDVDVIETTSAANIASLRADYQVVTDYATGQTFVMLSASKAPFDNVHARRALAFATDRQALVDTFGADEPIGLSTSPFEEDSFWGGLAPDETNYPQYDPEQAKVEIEEYKKATEATELSFTLLGVATTDDLQLMQAIAEQWSEVGITANIETLLQNEVITTLVGGTSQAILYPNYAYPDPDGNYVFWSKTFAEPPIIINFSQFYNQVTQDALDLGRQATDRDFRKQAYDELVKERNANAIDVWLYDTPWAMVADTDVRGLNWFRAIPFAGYIAKPYITGMWIEPGA